MPGLAELLAKAKGDDEREQREQREQRERAWVM